MQTIGKTLISKDQISINSIVQSLTFECVIFPFVMQSL